MENKSPVVAFHVEKEVAGEDAEKLRDSALAPLRLVDAADVAWTSDWNATRGRLRSYRSYYCLCFAVLHSPFEATLLMNADTLFVENPSRWWHLPNVQRTGVLFFSDKVSRYLWNSAAGRISVCNETRAFANTYGYPLRSTFEADYGSFCSGETRHKLESSFTLLNRSHVGVVRLLATLRHLLWHVFDRSRESERQFHVAHWGYGDKELYWLASELAGHTPYFSPRGPPAAVGPLKGAHKRATCFAHLVPVGNGAVSAQDSDISHLNMAHDCGWDADDANANAHPFGVKAPLWSSPFSHKVVRHLSPDEAQMFAAFRHDVSTSMASSSRPETRGAIEKGE